MPIHRKRFRAETAISGGGLPMPEIVESNAGPMHSEIMSELRAIRAQMAAAPKGADSISESAMTSEAAEAQALLETYRAQIEQWAGYPVYPPLGAIRSKRGKTTVYASWNGATQVASWRVLAATSGGQFHPVATTVKSGFETAIPLPQAYQRYQLQALDPAGHLLGTSHAFG